MTQTSTIELKTQLLELLQEFEHKNKFQIYRAFSHLKSPKKSLKDAEQLTNIFFNLREKLQTRDWHVPFEVFINEGIIFIGKDTDITQFSAYVDDKGLGIFSVNKANTSQIDVIELADSELEAIAGVISLLLILIEARKQSVADGILKI
jgi:hypothetical protein